MTAYQVMTGVATLVYLVVVWLFIRSLRPKKHRHTGKW